MTRDAILQKLNAVLRDVLDDDKITLSEESTARSVPGWDSVANIRIMLGIEEEFGFRFGLGEYSDFRNVGDLISGVDRHLR
jgi:acyl carrier protein